MLPDIQPCPFECVDAAIRVLSQAKYDLGMSIQDLPNHKESKGEDGDVSSTTVGLCQTQTDQNKYQHTTLLKKLNQNNQESRRPRASEWLDSWAKTQALFDRQEGEAAGRGLEHQLGRSWGDLLSQHPYNRTSGVHCQKAWHRRRDAWGSVTRRPGSTAAQVEGLFCIPHSLREKMTS